MAKEILETAPYLALPTEFDIQEYRIMERFCDAVDDDEMRGRLCSAIRGRSAFRDVKDKIRAYGIADDGYPYRDESHRSLRLTGVRNMGPSVYGMQE